MIWILGLLFVAWMIIYPVTDLYTRYGNAKVIKRGCIQGKKIHLSFDDGPDPRNTPTVLEILSRYRVPATFFLVGKKAEQHPDLVQRIIAAGHEVGTHTYEHRHAYRMFFSRSRAAFTRGKAVLEDITGTSLRWARPPWGAVNYFQYMDSQEKRLNLVLWTINAQDWLVKSTPALIEERLLSGIKPGSIIVLHDSGGEPGAPANTLEALPKVIQSLQESGYQFVSLSEITRGGKDGIHQTAS